MSASSVTVLDGTGAAKTLATFTDAANAQRYQVSGDSSIAHYRSASSQFSMVATPTAVVILPGNSTTTVRVKRIELSGIATSAGSMRVAVKKNSDAGTLGSAALTALTAVPMDSSAAASSSVASTVGTANYTTLPALVGTIAAGEVELGASGTGAFAPLVFEFGLNGRQSLVLRGAAQSLTIDFLGATIPSGGKLDVAIEWAEDAS